MQVFRGCIILKALPVVNGFVCQDNGFVYQDSVPLWQLANTPPTVVMTDQAEAGGWPAIWWRDP